MRFHGRRTGEIPPDILKVGRAERGVRGDNVVLIVLRKIIVVMPGMVVVIPVHAAGMRGAAGAEPRAMRPGGMRARRAAMPSTAAATVIAAATATAAAVAATTTTTTTTTTATTGAAAASATAITWRGEGWSGREQYCNQDREVLFHGDLLKGRRTGGGPDNGVEASRMRMPEMRMKERFMQTSLARFGRPLDPIIHRIHACPAAFIRADTQNCLFLS
jgi:hypothetical protein